MTRYLVKIKQDNKEVFNCSTKSKRRLLNRLRDFNCKEEIECYIKVNYGEGLNCNDKKVSFFNEGNYNSKKSLLEALETFDYTPLD